MPRPRYNKVMVDWLDAHTHLDSEELYPRREELLKRAFDSGVKKILLVNSEATEISFDRTLECLNPDSPVERFVSFGIHPHHAARYSIEVEKTLIEFLEHPRVIAFGEIGLDYYYDFSPQDVQVSVFRRQLELVLERNLPVVIHCRDAYGQLADLLKSESDRWRGMIHCFTGTPEEAEALTALGFFISFSGIVTFRNATVLRAAAHIVPRDRVLIETDAPYLAPVPKRGKTNEPAFVAYTGKFLAELRSASIEEFSQQVWKNFSTLFGV